MRAVSRLMLPAQLALAMFAAVGLDAWLARLRNRWRLFGTVALTLVVMAESATAIAFVRPPTSQDDGGVDQALQRLPRGVVLELPIASSRQPGWIYNEPSRQLLALHDSDPRVNGYSGFEPAGFPLRVALLNTFPSRSALNTARQLGVRYVVLRTALVGDVEPAAIRTLLERDGVGRYDDRTARQLVSEMPPASTTRVESLRGAYLIELA
jgi:hypothetical protein